MGEQHPGPVDGLSRRMRLGFAYRPRLVATKINYVRCVHGSRSASIVGGA
jgi:hypothetical protein